MTQKQLTKLDNFVIFKTDHGKVNIDVFFANETLWLTQKLMGELFEVEANTINYHLKEIFQTGELDEKATIRKFRVVQQEGQREVERNLTFYNLDAIIAVGYRVNSKQATKFRIWANNVLKEFIVKGFVLDDERLKQGQHFGQDYFEELLARIREIRASERRLYQKITDIYALSADYDSSAEITRTFFATVQNKLHWAITGKTAAEIIYSQADAQKAYMGLKNWKNGPDGKILKSDISVAKNYLRQEHIAELERLVSAYLDLAENRAKRGIVMNMEDWVKFLNRFLELSDYPILADKG
ncbi:MAG: cell filamentation protein Fic, partial [Candidatus Pacebacteria bacterium]|nr:cell filamentation protein Fic [Candidatus Paceibacterota bacterium]